jgi:outer membrane protein TolC
MLAHVSDAPKDRGRFAIVVCLCALAGRARGAEPARETPAVTPAPASPAPSPPPDTYEEPEFIREPPVLPEGVDAATARRLSLTDAIALAVKNNLGIVLVKQQVAIAAQGIEQSLGLFEPTLNASYLHQAADSPADPTQVRVPGSLLEVTNDRWIAGYSQRIRLGTQLDLQWTNDRTKSQLDTGLEPLLYRSELRLQLTQPLLRGFAFRWEVPNADVLRAEVASERAKQDYKGSVIATIRDTEDAYWDLVQALESYQVQQGSLKLAREQLGLTGRQIEAGVLPPSDLINAEGTLAQRELGLVQADSAVAQSADQLRHLLNLPRADWAAPILPLDAPEFDQLSVTFEAALNQALQNRPELAKLKLDLKRAALDLRVASSDRLPQLDASVSYGLVGQRSGYPDTVNQLFSADERAWSAILSFSWAPLNQTARAKQEALRLSERSLRTLEDQTLLDLRLELRTAIRGLETADRSVRAAAKFRTLAERSLDAEQRKFLNGTSNNFFVAQRQDDLSRARLAELAALIQHRKAATALRAAMGVLLEHRHVQLDVRSP